MFEYGYWEIVVINSLIFIMFAFSFVRPKNVTDWRVFGTFSAFIVALFTEMYGFPLTIYLLSGWLSEKFPQLDLFAHDSGHLWYELLGISGDPHTSPIHIASTWFINGGLLFLAITWMFLYRAQRKGVVAKSGPYALIRHPQYVAFIVIMFGFLLQWPTLLTLLMFPILVIMYMKLAKIEERESIKAFGEEYATYADDTGRFFPNLKKLRKKFTINS
ncbi:Isoprenylcysteine carboxyl methyltransferase [Desulfitobacterium hafniense]|uniref:Isoprenylcysteine carboxyl methyltransferase n=1 Tax=Desulfitobacterium hafniense TaxID=49338 RepID=A0A098B8W0_DESHA|nr:isoprenylcysteine carboxylmethyltransferase family protein [Desulfitobacterium hafniense]CDX04795.1 Isoprenylcysteine carboxyl methyltransferase [Desulfitobacterium hafniense]